MAAGQYAVEGQIDDPDHQRALVLANVYGECAKDLAAVLDTEGDRPTPRPETGPMQFGDDWPGLFIRGDNAAGYSLALNMAIDATKDPLTLAQLRSLRSLLVGCDVRNSPEVQHARIVPRPDPPVQP
jgi:hypothetical protein